MQLDPGLARIRIQPQIKIGDSMIDDRNSPNWHLRHASSSCAWIDYLKRLFVLVLIASTAPSAVAAGWIDKDGKPIPNRQDVKSSDGFGVMLVLTADEAAFARAWNSPVDRPFLSTTKSVQRGKSVSAMLLFSGCMPNSAGTCNVSVAYRLVNPDGTVQNTGSYNAWQRVAPKPGIVALGDAHLTIGVAHDDPIGNLSVSATVTDLNSGRSIAVSTTLMVTP